MAGIIASAVVATASLLAVMELSGQKAAPASGPANTPTGSARNSVVSRIAVAVWVITCFLYGITVLTMVLGACGWVTGIYEPEDEIGGRLIVGVGAFVSLVLGISFLLSGLRRGNDAWMPRVMRPLGLTVAMSVTLVFTTAFAVKDGLSLSVGMVGMYGLSAGIPYLVLYLLNEIDGYLER